MFYPAPPLTTSKKVEKKLNTRFQNTIPKENLWRINNFVVRIVSTVNGEMCYHNVCFIAWLVVLPEVVLQYENERYNTQRWMYSGNL